MLIGHHRPDINEKREILKFLIIWCKNHASELYSITDTSGSEKTKEIILRYDRCDNRRHRGLSL